MSVAFPQRRAVSINHSYSEKDKDKSSLHFGSNAGGRYSDFQEEEMLKERARRFIAKIHRLKARNDGEFLFQKRQAEQRRNKRQKLRTDALLRRQQQQIWQKRSKILEKIYTKELEKQQKFAQSVLKQRFRPRKPNEEQEKGNKRGERQDQKRKVGKPDLCKRHKTVQDEQSHEAGFPHIESSTNIPISVDLKKYKPDLKKQQLLYLSNKDRVSISQIHQKIDQLNKLTRNTGVSNDEAR